MVVEFITPDFNCQEWDESRYPKCVEFFLALEIRAYNCWTCYVPKSMAALFFLLKSSQCFKTFRIGITRKYPLRGYFLGVLTHTTAWDRLWEGEQTQVLVKNSLGIASLGSSLICLLKLWPCGFKIEYTYLGFASAAAVWQGFWNSNHVGLKLSICSLALPRSAVVWLASGTLTMWF